MFGSSLYLLSSPETFAQWAVGGLCCPSESATVGLFFIIERAWVQSSFFTVVVLSSVFGLLSKCDSTSRTSPSWFPMKILPWPSTGSTGQLTATPFGVVTKTNGFLFGLAASFSSMLRHSWGFFEKSSISWVTFATFGFFARSTNLFPRLPWETSYDFSSCFSRHTLSSAFSFLRGSELFFRRSSSFLRTLLLFAGGYFLLYGSLARPLFDQYFSSSSLASGGFAFCLLLDRHFAFALMSTI